MTDELYDEGVEGMTMFWCYLIALIGVGSYELKQHVEHGGHDFEGLLTVMLPFPLSGLLYVFWLVILNN